MRGMGIQLKPGVLLFFRFCFFLFFFLVLLHCFLVSCFFDCVLVKTLVGAFIGFFEAKSLGKGQAS